MAILNNNPLVGASGNQGGYNINNSLRFRSSASAYLSRTPASTSNQNTFTFSFWIKKGRLGSLSRFYVGRTSTNFPAFGLQIDDSLACDQYTTGGALQLQLITTQVFRDPSAWYHIVIAFDTTQATASNRIKFYVNGSQITAFSTATYPSQNLAVNVNTTNTQYIGADPAQPQYWDGYMAEFNFIDGSAKTPSDFGETDTTTGVWKPKAYTGTYGTNGFYLKFSDIATTSGSNAGLGKDFSGNSNYWTTNNISVTSGTTYDAMTDSPTNTSATVANYPTINPLQVATNTTVSEANLKALSSTTSSNKTQFATMGISSGKVYWETTWIACGANDACFVGVESNPTGASLTSNVGTTATSYAYNNNKSAANGLKVNNGSGSSYGSTWTSGDIIGCALDLDNGKIWWSKNGTWQASGDPAAGTNAAYTGLSGTFLPAWTIYNTSDAYQVNFGQRPFSYTPPTGFVALNTFNLSTPTILQGNKYMDATTYTGNGSTQVLVNQGQFKPDFVWVKARSATYNHTLYDSIRGVNNYLISNLTNAAASSSDTLQAFNSNGFTVGTNQGLNENASTYVGWQWQAGQGSTSSNTSGSITSTVSVNTTAGFSIVTYTGTGSVATVGHGLGVAPRMVIVKSRSAGSTDWVVYHASLGATQNVRLQSTAAAATQTVMWNDTAPTSTVFTIGTNNNVNTNAQTQVAYCWAEISGFSKFGSYTGNGSADGPFVFTNFRPKYVMIKGNAVVNWWILDTSRNTYNVANEGLLANSSAATNATINPVDFVSNGFKLRDSNGEINANGTTYVYACFAESPFKNSLAR